MTKTDEQVVSDDRLGCPGYMLPEVLRKDICLGAVESRGGLTV